LIFISFIKDTVVLVCVDNRQATSFTWRRNDKLLSDGRKINPMNNDTDNKSVVGDPSIGEYNLKISNLTSNDFGYYTCEAGNTYEMNVLIVKKGKLMHDIKFKMQLFNHKHRV
jgi:hypothetical protein